MRGLKSHTGVIVITPPSSHPTRVRGLKLPEESDVCRVELVAPYAGAWIEIAFGYKSYKTLFVAPYAGAWIEIYVMDMAMFDPVGRTLRGCVD